MANRRIAGLLALVVSAGAVYAQRYSFKYYGQDNGLSNLDALSLLQDRTGFLWVGTDNGLFRYDGRHFRMFGIADGLPSMQVYSLAETADGTLWTGSIVGVSRRVGNRFEKVDLKYAKGTRAIAADARHLYVTSEKGLMAAVVDGRSPPEFRLYQNPDGPGAAFGLALDRAGRVWYGCGRSICRFDGTRVVSFADWGVPPDEYTGIVVDAAGNLWARSISRLLELPAGSHRFVAKGRELAIAVRLARVYVDRQGDLLVSTARGLARRTSDDGWELTDKSNGLPGNTITSMLEDREGSLWIGVGGVGLVRWLGRRRWESWTEAEGLSHDVVWSVRRDGWGTLWAASENGLSRFDAEAKSWRPFHDPALRPGRTLALATAPDGKLWVGQNPGGITEIDPRTGRAVSHHNAQGLPTDRVMTLAFDAAGHLWAGTLDGLFEGVRTPAGLRFARIQLIPEEPAPTVAAVTCDRQGRIWATSSYGVLVRESGRWRRIVTADGLRHNRTMYLGEAADGAMWISYREPLGVVRIRLDGGRLDIRNFSTADGMRSNKTVFLGSDAAGRMWLGTDTGVERFDGRSWTHFDKTDGLIWNDCDAYSFLADPDGSVWFGTSRGLSHYYAAGAPERPLAAPVVLTTARLGESELPLDGGVSVPYSMRSFHAVFAALTYVNEESTRVRYRLLGLDSSWTETDDDDARFAGLSPGRYTFQVQAAAGPGQWDPVRQSFTFQIRPPWWGTWWAIAAGVTLCCLVSRRLYKWRLRNMLKRQKALEQAVRERTRAITEQKREIEQLFEQAQESARLKSEFLANISHEIRTPMNGIIGMTDLVLRTPLEADQTECLRLVKISADSLLSVINDVLDFSKIEAGKFDLDAVEFDPRELLQDAVKSMEVLAVNRGLGMECAIGDEVPRRVVGDPVRLRQVLINLIGNAVKFTERGGVKAELAASGEGAIELRFAVRDSGVGIPADKQELIFEPFRQADGSTSRRFGGTGLGLAISARLVALMQGRIWVDSRPGAGSTFSFTALVQPAQAHPAADAGAAPEAIPAPARSLRVLVAEDNPINRKLATRLLEKAGHAVSCAHDGREAVDMFSREHFDLVLMDVQMPHMDGFEATMEIRQLEAALRIHTPVLALTANAMKGDRERCLQAGMDAYVAKPLKPVELMGAIAELTAP